MSVRGSVTAPVADLGVLLPVASLKLLAAGAEGMSAAREFGLVVDDFEAEFSALEEQLRLSSHPEAASALLISQQIASDARSAHGWLSVRASGEDPSPSLALLCPDDVLIARLHGPVVEWIRADLLAVGRLVRRTTDERATSVMVTVFCGGASRGGALVGKDTVDVAARDQGELERLADAARRGPDSVLTALAELARAQSRS